MNALTSVAHEVHWLRLVFLLIFPHLLHGLVLFSEPLQLLAPVSVLLVSISPVTLLHLLDSPLGLRWRQRLKHFELAL